MKKKCLAVFLAVLMLIGVSLTAFAASPAIQYTSSYNADTGLVSVTLFVSDALGLEAADLNLAYNTSEYSFVDCTDNKNVMVVAGKAETEDGLCTCSVIFVESCVAEDLDENGNLVLATYQFKPLTDKYDIDNFCAWATSYQSSGTNMLGSIKSYGNENLKVGHDKEVTVKKDTSSNASSSGIGSKWYVYVIAAVLAVCAVVGIAVIAVKNGQQDASGDAENGKNRKKKSDKAGSGPEETDPSDQDESEE